MPKRAETVVRRPCLVNEMLPGNDAERIAGILAGFVHGENGWDDVSRRWARFPRSARFRRATGATVAPHPRSAAVRGVVQRARNIAVAAVRKPYKSAFHWCRHYVLPLSSVVPAQYLQGLSSQVHSIPALPLAQLDL